jgi:hypothetical protein
MAATSSSSAHLTSSPLPSSVAAASASASSSVGALATHQTSLTQMDDLVKEYLLFRGFQSTLKSLEHELKSDKSSCFRADKCTDLLLSYIHAYELTALLDYWSYMDQKFFARLTLKPATLTRKYELFLLRYYVVNAVQTSRVDKAMEFLEQCASKLQGQLEWRDWYLLPFLKNPEENPVFAVYFGRNWIDTFVMSLQNFLNVVFQSVPFPRLLNYDEDAFWNRQQSRAAHLNNNQVGLV